MNYYLPSMTTHPSVMWMGLLEERGALNACALESPKLRISKGKQGIKMYTNKEMHTVRTYCKYSGLLTEANGMQLQGVGHEQIKLGVTEIDNQRIRKSFSKYRHSVENWDAERE